MKINRTWLQITVFSIILVIGIVTVIFNLRASQDEGMPAIGQKPPEFELNGLDGKKHQLSEWNDKLVVINFWGTFCPPCRNEMPALQKQYEKWNAKGVEIVGISVDKNKVTVENFIKQNEITFPILLDFDEQVRMNYSVMNYPTTFFLLPNGKVALTHVGEMSESFIDEQINTLLKK